MTHDHTFSKRYDYLVNYFKTANELAESITSENVNKKNLVKAFKKIQSKKFKRSLTKVSNPYFKKNSSSNVVKIIKRLKINEIELKPFFDLGRRR
mgnify:CR=1 FL=1